MSYPTVEDHYLPALRLWHDLESRPRPLPESDWPNLRDLVRLSSPLYRARFALLWESQLPAPARALVRIPEGKGHGEIILAICENGTIAWFEREDGKGWHSGGEKPLPGSSVFVGLNPPVRLRNVSAPASLVVRPSTGNEPDEAYAITFVSGRELQLLPSQEDELPARQILVPRRFGQPTGDGLASLQAIPGESPSACILQGQSLFGPRAEETLPFRPLAIVYSSNRIFASGYGEVVLSWRWRGNRLNLHPDWPDSGLELDEQASALAILRDHHGDPCLLVGCDERQLLVVSDEARILEKIRVPRNVTAIEPLETESALWLADETGRLSLVQPVYSRLDDGQLPAPGDLLAMLPDEVRPGLYQEWLASEQPDLAEAVAQDLAASLANERAWAEELVADLAAAEGVESNQLAIRLLIEALTDITLAQSDVTGPAVSHCVTTLHLLRESSRPQLQRLIDRFTGRLAARFPEKVPDLQGWQALNNLRKLGDHELAADYAAEGRLEDAVAAQAETLLHRRTTVWTFATEDPIRGLAPLDESEDVLVTTRQGQLFRFNFKDRQHRKPTRSTEDPQGVPSALVPLPLDDAVGARQAILATVQGDLYLWQLEAGFQEPTLQHLQQVDLEIRNLTLIPAAGGPAERLILVGNAGRIQLYERRAGNERWQFKTESSLAAEWLRALCVADLGAEQGLRILAGGAKPDGRGILYFVDPGTLRPLADIDFESPVLDAAVLTRPDDGQKLIALVSANGFVHLIRPDGCEEWRYRVGRSARNLEICDLSRPGVPELIVGGEIEGEPGLSNHLVVLGLDGAARWIIPTPAPVTHIKAIHPSGRQAHILIGDLDHIVQVVEVIPPYSRFEREVGDEAGRYLEELVDERGETVGDLLSAWLHERHNPSLQSFACYQVADQAQNQHYELIYSLLAVDLNRYGLHAQRAYVRALVRVAAYCGDNPEAGQVMARLRETLSDRELDSLVVTAALREMTLLESKLHPADFAVWQPVLLAAAGHNQAEVHHAILSLTLRLGQDGRQGLKDKAWEIIRAVLAHTVDEENWVLEDIARILRDSTADATSLWHLAHRALDEMGRAEVLLSLGRSQLPLLPDARLARVIEQLGNLSLSQDPEEAQKELHTLVSQLGDQTSPAFLEQDDLLKAAYRLMDSGASLGDEEQWQGFVADLLSAGGLRRLVETLEQLDSTNAHLNSQLQSLQRNIQSFQTETLRPEGLRRLTHNLDSLARRLLERESLQGLSLSPLNAALAGMLGAWIRSGGVLDRWWEKLTRPAEPEVTVVMASVRPGELVMTANLYNPSQGVPIEDLDLRLASAHVQLGDESLRCYPDEDRVDEGQTLEPQATLTLRLRAILSEQIMQGVLGKGQTEAHLNIPISYFLPPKEWKRATLKASFKVKRRSTAAINLPGDLPTAWGQIRQGLQAVLGPGKDQPVFLICPPIVRVSIVEKVRTEWTLAGDPFVELDAREWLSAQHLLIARGHPVSAASFLAWVAESIWPDARVEIEAIRGSGAPRSSFRRLAGSRPQPGLVIVNHWDRLLIGAATSPKPQWPPMDDALPTIFDWCDKKEVPLVFVGSQLARRIMEDRWPALLANLSFIRMDTVDVTIPAVAAELDAAIGKQLDTRALRKVLDRFDPPLTQSEIGHLCGGHLHCLEMMFLALEAAERLDIRQLKKAEDYFLSYARQRDFFSMLWMWQDFYSRVALVLAAHGELPVENKNWVEEELRLVNDYYSRRPDGSKPREPVLRAGAILRDVDVTTVRSNQYYRKGDLSLRGFAPEIPAPPKWGAAGEMWIHLLRAGLELGVMDNLVEAGVLRQRRPRRLPHYYEHAIPLYELWVTRNGIWESLLNAAKAPSSSWYPRHLAVSGRDDTRIFPERSPGAAHKDIPFSDAARIERFLNPQIRPLFFNAYGLAGGSACAMRRRWRSLVDLSGALNKWFAPESDQSESEIGETLPQALFSLLDLKPLPELLQGETFCLRGGKEPRDTILWTYAQLGGSEEVLRKRVIVAVLRDSDAHTDTANDLFAYFKRQLGVLHDREEQEPEGIAEGSEVDEEEQRERAKERAEKMERSVVYLVAPEPARGLRRAIAATDEFPHLVLLTPSQLVSCVVDSRPAEALVREAFRVAGRHPFSPYQLSGRLIGGSPLFVGRKQELDSVIHSLEDQDYVILGSRRIGKTSLLHQIAYRLRERDSAPHLLISLNRNSDEDDFYVLLKLALERQLKRPDLAGRLASKPTGRFADLSNVMQILRDEFGSPVVLLLDEIDGLYLNDLNNNEQRLFQFLRNNLAQNEPRLCTFVMTGFRHIFLERLSHLSVFYNFSQFINLSGVDEEAVDQLVDKLRQFNITLVDQSEIVGRIAKDTYAIPNLVQLACDNLLRRLDNAQRDRHYHDGPDQITPDDAQVVLREDVHTLIKGELWDNLKVDPIIYRGDGGDEGDEGVIGTLEQARTKLKIVILATILSLYEHKLDQATAHFPLPPEKAEFSAGDAVGFVRDWAGEPWPLSESEVDQLLRSLTMTMALSPSRTELGYTFPNDILPDVLCSYHRQKRLDLGAELDSLVHYLQSISKQ